MAGILSNDMINKIFCENCLDTLKRMNNDSVDCVITSPPYWGLRDYGVEGQIGLEPSLEEYIEKLFLIMKELKRVLKPTGVIFWNHGDSYGGSGMGLSYSIHTKGKNSILPDNLNYLPKVAHTRGKYNKSMLMQNYRLILRCIDELGLVLRNIIIWHKPNGMPASVKDRFANKYEPVFMMVKSKKYWFDLDSIRKPHKQESIERAKRAISSNHKYANLPNYGGGGGLNNPRPNTKHDIAIKRIGYYSYKDPLHNRPLHPLGANPGDVWQIAPQPQKISFLCGKKKKGVI